MISKEILEKLYYKEKLSYRKVAERLGVESKTVLLNMQKYNLKMRTQKEAIRNSIKRGEWNKRYGKDHPLWNGGEFLDFNGYRVINIDHLTDIERQLFEKMFFGHSNTLIFEHRYIMARQIGRALVKGEEVHHLNGIKDDNRLSNLLLLQGRKHRELIPALMARIKELEERLKKYE